jgi:predicted CxxxxCH...CXXCH cytochrome family protein
MHIHSALIKMVSVPLALVSLVACSGSNSSAPAAVDANGKHPDNWLQQHWVAYRQANGGSKAVSSGTNCSECHGSDLSGGIAKVSCFTASYNGVSCHANADHTLGHPASWSVPTSAGFHSSAFGSNLNPSQLGKAIDSNCVPCHAADSAAIKVAGAPSCLSADPKWGIACHVSNPKTGCSSCHSTPPTGSAVPNRAGAHTAHLSLAGVTCSTCHASYGSGTVQHATARFQNHTTAYVKLAFAYTAESGTLGFSAGSCSGISCHGGKQTPDWNSGSINISTDCLSCHQQQDPQNPQYNSFYSGNYLGTNLHTYHLGLNYFCTDCHSVSKMDNRVHFAALETASFEMAPGETIGGAGTQVGSYDVSTGSCTNNCHTQAPNPAHWNN